MELTKEQANDIFRFKKNLLAGGFTSEVDRIGLAASCEAFYRAFTDSKKPSVYIANCPDDAHELLEHLMGIQTSNAYVDVVEAGKFTSDESLRKDIDGRVFGLLKEIKAEAKETLGHRRFREVRNILFRDLNFQFSRSVFQVIEQSILNKWKEQGRSIREFSSHPSYADRDWLNFYRGCSEILSIDCEALKTYQEFIDQGLFSGYFHREFAVLVPLPQLIRKNENLVLHDEEQAAVFWNGGARFAYWNGIEVPEKLILQPDTIKAEDILRESNAEVRRCYQEKLGSERFGNLLGLITLDEKSDRFGNPQKLYRTKEVDKIAGDFIYFAQVVCPSTGRKYFLCVPPGLSSVEEAVAWTFGKTPGDYRPSIET